MAKTTADNPSSIPDQVLSFASKAKPLATLSRSYSEAEMLHLAQALLNSEAVRHPAQQPATAAPPRAASISSLATLAGSHGTSGPLSIKHPTPDAPPTADIAPFPAAAPRQAKPKKTPT